MHKFQFVEKRNWPRNWIKCSSQRKNWISNFKSVSSEGGSRQRLDKRMKEKRHDKYKIKSNAKKQVCVNASGNDKLVPRRAQKRGEKSILFVRSFEKNLKRRLQRRSNVFSVTSTMRPLIRPKFNLSKRTNWSEKMDTGR